MAENDTISHTTQENDNFKLLSASIACVRFPLVLYILFLHAFTVDSLAGHPLYFKVIYPFALWIGETGVPAYFFISGMLFFYSKKSFEQKIKDRLTTLVIPYLIWNGLIILGYYLAYVAGGHDSLINNDKYISEYTAIDYVRAFWDRGDWGDSNGKPILPPMWYIRNLFLLCLFSPVIQWVIQKTKVIVPILLVILWISFQNDVYVLQSLSIFSLGALFPILGIDLIDFLRKHQRMLLLMFGIVTLSDFLTHIVISIPMAHLAHRLALILNIFATIWMGVVLSQRGITFKTLSHMAFFIFCVHLPIMIVLRRPVLSHIEWSSAVHIACYFVSVIVCTIVCIGIYIIFKRCFPRFLRVSTGSRN